MDNPIRFFVDDTFKVWSENGDVKQCRGNDESLKYIYEVAEENSWELYNLQLGKKLKPAFNAVLAGEKQ